MKSMGSEGAQISESMGSEGAQISEMFGLVKLNINMKFPHRFLPFRLVPSFGKVNSNWLGRMTFFF